jgi:hypothetical protein
MPLVHWTQSKSLIFSIVSRFCNMAGQLKNIDGIEAVISCAVS